MKLKASAYQFAVKGDFQITVTVIALTSEQALGVIGKEYPYIPFEITGCQNLVLSAQVDQITAEQDRLAAQNTELVELLKYYFSDEHGTPARKDYNLLKSGWHEKCRAAIEANT